MRSTYSVLLLFLPVVLHECLVAGRPDIAAILYAALLSAPALSRVVSGRRPGKLAVILLLSAVALLVALRYSRELLLFKLMSASIYLVLMAFFGMSLYPGRMPIITRVATLMHPGLSSRAIRYTRAVTWAWTVFFLLMLSASVILAVFAGEHAWSLFTNVVGYVLIAIFFLMEFLVRRIVLAGEADYSLRSFLHGLTRIDLRSVLWKSH